MLEQNQIPYEFVISCYPKSGQKLYYIDSRDLDYTYKIRVSEFPAWVADRVESSESEYSFFTVGHSHGGWMSLQVALNLGQDVDMVGVMTLDPISRLKCKTPFTANLANLNVLSRISMNYVNECLQAPSDISPEEYQYISDRAFLFSNYYQVTAPYLHSSEILGAENYLVDDPVGGVFDTFGPHVRIDTNEDAWQQFDANVLGEFGM